MKNFSYNFIEVDTFPLLVTSSKLNISHYYFIVKNYERKTKTVISKKKGTKSTK
jgi:hypothetical protein